MMAVFEYFYATPLTDAGGLALSCESIRSDARFLVNRADRRLRFCTRSVPFFHRIFYRFIDVRYYKFIRY